MAINAKDMLIALDDGHGMSTSGKRTPIFKDGTKSKETSKNFMHENEFNRAVVKYLDAHLKRCGFRTLLVAPTDADTPLTTRVSIANRAKANLYVSVHANANAGNWGAWGGIETFTSGKGEGLRVGKIIHKHMMKGTKLRDRGMKLGTHLYVIKATKMASVLIEAGFMDNLEEAKLLLSDAYRRETALEVAQGICEAYDVKFVAEITSKAATTVTDKKTTTKEWYRVRRIWSDSKTQVGAFLDLESAKELADAKGIAFKVFDGKGKGVYSPRAKNVKGLYRIRKSWSNVSSQVGAYHDLDKAKDLADRNKKEGYKVFDENGKVVYTPK